MSELKPNPNLYPHNQKKKSVPINLHTFERNEWLVIGTADNALAEMVKAALFGHSHPSYRWPARSQRWAVLTELHLLPRTGRPVLCPYRGLLPLHPTFPFLSLPKRTTPTGYHRSSHQAFPEGKTAAFLGKSPQDVVKPPGNDPASTALLENIYFNFFFFFKEVELGAWLEAHLKQAHTWDFDCILVNSVLLAVQVLQAHRFCLHRGVLRCRQGGVRANHQYSQANPQYNLHNVPELQLAQQNKRDCSVQHSSCKQCRQTIQNSVQLHTSIRDREI